eukprot:g3051.t1
MPITDLVLWTERPLLDAKSPIPAIACRLLKARLKKLMENRGRGIYAEFEQLRELQNFASCDEALTQKAQIKNRYSNIIPFDYNRVRLGANGNGPYINASFVESSKGEDPMWSFIATQGPTRHTIDDFWRMVFEQRCQAIVMLTQFTEKYTEKCAQYYPLDEGEEMRTTNFKIRVQEEQDISRDITVRTLEIIQISTAEAINVYHYYYHEWPDHGIPQFTRPTRDLINILEKSEAMKSRIVVHCSAGVGRTGVFCAISVVLHRLKALQDDFSHIAEDAQNNSILEEKIESAMNFPQLITSFRYQRDGMVQTIDQYYFCYQTVIQELDSVLSRK